MVGKVGTAVAMTGPMSVCLLVAAAAVAVPAAAVCWRFPSMHVESNLR